MNRQPVHVAVGVVQRENGEVLIAQRALDAHQGGLWEFPGGKVEPGEDSHMALTRELKEEVGIHVIDSLPLQKIIHTYPDKSVLLDVHLVYQCDGEARGLENQPLQWTMPETLNQFDFPVANHAIVKALQLDSVMAVTGKFISLHEFGIKLERSLQAGVRLVQLRAPWLDKPALHEVFASARALCTRYQARLLLNTRVEWIGEFLDADGFHLSVNQAAAMRADDTYHNHLRDSQYYWGCSCHNAAEIACAEALNVDYVSVSPVCVTASHPHAVPIGWRGFERLSRSLGRPVFALGGLGPSDLSMARQHAAYGVASLSAFW